MAYFLNSSKNSAVVDFKEAIVIASLLIVFFSFKKSTQCCDQRIVAVYVGALCGGRFGFGALFSFLLFVLRFVADRLPLAEEVLEARLTEVDGCTLCSSLLCVSPKQRGAKLFLF